MTAPAKRPAADMVVNPDGSVTWTFTRLESYALTTFIAQPGWVEAARLVAKMFQAKGI